MDSSWKFLLILSRINSGTAPKILPRMFPGTLSGISQKISPSIPPDSPLTILFYYSEMFQIFLRTIPHWIFHEIFGISPKIPQGFLPEHNQNMFQWNPFRYFSTYSYCNHSRSSSQKSLQGSIQNSFWKLSMEILKRILPGFVLGFPLGLLTKIPFENLPQVFFLEPFQGCFPKHFLGLGIPTKHSKHSYRIYFLSRNWSQISTRNPRDSKDFFPKIFQSMLSKRFQWLFSRLFESTVIEIPLENLFSFI